MMRTNGATYPYERQMKIPGRNLERCLRRIYLRSDIHILGQIHSAEGIRGVSLAISRSKYFILLDLCISAQKRQGSKEFRHP